MYQVALADLLDSTSLLHYRAWPFPPSPHHPILLETTALAYDAIHTVSLLMKQSTYLTELALFDVVPVVKGVAVDLSHINTPSVVTGYTKDDDGLAKALKGCDIVVIPAGVPRKPGMTR